MRNIIGIVVIVIGIALAVYGGLVLMLYGGIMQALNAWGVDNAVVAWGIIRAIFTSLGFLPGYIVILIGYAGIME